MKTIKLATTLAISALALLFAACSETESIDESMELAEKSAELLTAPGDSCIISGTLNEAEIEGLFEMREEEKLARDVYSFFYEKHGHIVFNNISKSENAHTSAVLYLMNAYGLEDNALPELGKFSNPLFTELYAKLTEQGESNLLEALKVGAFIEEYDIADLWKLIEESENESIKRVYGNLLRGSEFHLRAFTNVLKVQGAVYEPSIISEEQYQEILTRDNTSDDETEDSTFTPPATCNGTGPNS